MASISRRQIWLTYALTDDDVPKALSLCVSLKRVSTSKGVGVIASQKISTKLKMALLRGFDFFFHMEEDLNTAKLENEDFVKVFSFTLKSFDKCVLLAPTILAVKNPDKLFEEQDRDGCALLGKVGDFENSGVFGVKPSMGTFEILMECLLNRSVSNVETFLRDWSRNQTDYFVLEKTHCGLLSPGKEYLLENASTFPLINMIGIPFEVDTKSFGLIAQLVLEQRKQIYEMAVQPLLNSQKSSAAPELSPHRYDDKEPVAIVGMSCRFPKANNPNEFWNTLVNGVDATGAPPEFRWLPEQSIKHGERFRKINAGFLKCPVDTFDAKFFGISPIEVSSMDPQQRLLHEVVWEGLEDAAINPHSLKGSSGGVFVGSMATDFKDILAQSGDTEFFRSYMGNSIGTAAGRISFLLGMTGPSIATESGCSSSMAALHLACKSLRNKESSLALACGVNLILEPFDSNRMLTTISPEGRSKTFDARADGYGRAEGVAVLVLKRLSDAVKNGDRIWALVRGTALTQEGLSKSMGTPTVNCEALAMKQALADAGIEPAQVSYVEAHGTGTVVGDPTEVEAISKAYHSKKRKEPLIIGSVKTNIGHTESCAGIAGVMKVVLAMKNEVIPAHVHFKTLNPSIDLEAVPAIIPLENIKWETMEGKPRFAGVSSFGITGTDGHAIIEEPPKLPSNDLIRMEILERPLHIMKICAKNEEALNLLLKSYKQRLNSNRNDDDFKDLAFTANTGRPDLNLRIAIIASSTKEAVQVIEQQKFKRGDGEKLQNTHEKTCFLFTGQGSQYPGMAKELYETSPIFRIHFEICENYLKETYDINIASIMWSDDNSRLAQVGRTIYSQTSIFCVEYALLKLLESWGLKADYVLGHSLGEFAAAVCAGILDVQDALKLVAERSLLIDALPRGKMLVIKADKFQVDSTMKEFSAGDPTKLVDFAAINSNEQTVVAGDENVISEFQEYCKKSGLTCSILSATHAFHSKHMDPMLEQYRAIANTVAQGEDTSCKFISGMRGLVTEASGIDANYWVDHTRKKVEFLNASKLAVEQGCKTFIEIGPQPVLSALTMMNSNQQIECLPTLRKNAGDWKSLLTTVTKLYVEGMEIDWAGFDRFYNRKKVSLPHYPFIGKKFWPEITVPASITLHPLLGSAFVNPSSVKIFQSGLNPSNLEYLKDHCIGNHIIFPGAGYLEIAITAGLATIENCTDSLLHPVRPFKIENLIIEAPLELKETKSCQIQTTVSFNSTMESKEDWDDLSVRIYRKVDSESDKWVLHAESTFFPFPTPKDKEVELEEDFFKEVLQKPGQPTSELYNKLLTSGIKFGPTFRSLETVWRDESGKRLVGKVKAVSNSQSNYILHPVILDAMLQGIGNLFPITNWKKNFYVPVKIGKLVWLSEPTTPDFYVYAETLDSAMSSAKALLLDSSSQVIALISDVEMIETNLKVIESVLEQQRSSLPELWEEVWKKTKSSVELSVEMEKAKGLYISDELSQQFEKEFNTLPQDTLELILTLDRFVYLNYLRALYELGWKPSRSNQFVENSLFQELNIKPQLRKFFSQICQVLEEEGVLLKVEGDSHSSNVWCVNTVPPSYEETLTLLNSPQLSSDLVKALLPTLMLQDLGQGLSNFLNGSKSAMPILFPEEGTFPEGRSIVDFYSHAGQLFKIAAHQEQVTQNLLNYIRKSQSDHEFKLRILEVGAGTGAYSQTLINLLETEGIQFEYTYTDISSSFFGPAEKKFTKQLNSILFKKLNIEDDPLEQGFIPEYYDLVFAAEVIHATRNIVESLRHIRTLLKPFGKLLIYETTGVNRITTFLVGTLDGYWRFQDFDLRQESCLLDKGKWEEVLQSTGLEVEGSFSAVANRHAFIVSMKTCEEGIVSELDVKIKTWLVFHLSGNSISNYICKKIKAIPRRRVITVTEGHNFEVSVDEGKAVLRRQSFEDFFALLTQLSSRQVEIEGILYCWALDNTVTEQEQVLQPYFNLTKSILILDEMPKLAFITSGVVPLSESSNMSGFHASTLWGYTKSMKNENFVWNIKCIDIARTESSLNGNQLRQLFHEIWNSSGDLQVAFSENSRFIPKVTPCKSGHNPLKIPTGSQRFNLVLAETGAISDLKFGPLESDILKDSDIEVGIKAYALNFRDLLTVLKPDLEFRNSNLVGSDIAGVITKVGSKVSKWKVGDRVIGCNKGNQAFPSHLITDQDLFVPCPDTWNFSEAATVPTVYITVIRCLIEIAKITKKDTVLIHTATGGVGLSAVEICKYIGCNIICTVGSNRKKNYLKSLGIEHIFHSRNTNFGSQILELTKGHGVDVVLNSLTGIGFKEATLMCCAKNARFVEMSRLNIWRSEEVQKLRPDVSYTLFNLATVSRSEFSRCMGLLQAFLDKGVVKPLPKVIFDALNIQNALQYMQQAKCIGKIVCMMPTCRMEQGAWSVRTPIFGDKSTYLITGGCGGIGLEVCRWMLKNGAVHVVLASRNPPSLSLREQILEMNSKGGNVTTVELDVGQYEDCKRLVDTTIPSLGLPPIKGIMHAAGVLNDGLIATMDWEKLSSTFSSKISGTLNLHEISKNESLEFFMLFSSIASIFGNTCQSNHAAANAFEDAFANYRHSLGLPATTINWGLWGQVGVGKESEIPGAKTLSNLQGLTGLEYIMKTQRIQTSIPNFGSVVALSKFVPIISSLLDERVWKDSVNTVVTIIGSADFWQTYNTSQNNDETIGDLSNLQEIGMDSLLFIEVRNCIQVLVGENLVVSTSALKSCDTVNSFASTLVNLIEEKLAKQGSNMEISKENAHLESPIPKFGDRLLLAYTIHNPSAVSSAAPIFIAHGFMGERSEWDAIAHVIAEQTNRRAITFDARSHGDSPSELDDELTYEVMADDLIHLSKHLDMETFSILGHSMGGKTGMTLALKYPELVEELVVVDISPFEENYYSANSLRWFTILEEILPNAKLSKGGLAVVKEELDAALESIGCTADVRTYILANLIIKNGKIIWGGIPSLDMIIRSVPNLREFSEDCLNNRFEKPALFLKSEKSDHITYEIFPKIRQVFTNAEINVIQNADHFPHLGAYNGFIEAVLRFLLR